MSQLPPKTLGVGDTIEVSYIKSSAHRVILADGAYGGISPRRHITFSLYNERQALPRKGQLSVSDGSVNEVIVDTRGGLVREVEVTVMMDIDEAESFAAWLSDKVKLFREMDESDAV